METIELDENTIKNIKALESEKEKLMGLVETADHMIQTILTTVINVKGLTGKWVLGADMKLIKEVES